MEKSKKRIRELILYEYRLGHTAMEATNNICLAEGEHAVSKATVFEWYKKFRSDMLDLVVEKSFLRKREFGRFAT